MPLAMTAPDVNNTRTGKGANEFDDRDSQIWIHGRTRNDNRRCMAGGYLMGFVVSVKLCHCPADKMPPLSFGSAMLRLQSTSPPFPRNLPSWSDWFLLCSWFVPSQPAHCPLARHLAAAEPGRGGIQSIEKDWTVRLIGESAPAEPADLISLRRTDLRLPPYPSTAQVVFANGDRIPGEVQAIENEQIRFRAMLADAPYRDHAYQEMTIPLSAIAEIWFNRRRKRIPLNRIPMIAAAAMSSI